MKILVINHEFPPIGGGGSTGCRYIAEHLAASGAQVTVLTSAFKDLPKEDKAGSVTIKRICSARKESHTGRVFEFILFLINGALFLRKEIKEDRPDMVYAFFTVPSGALALFLKKAYNIPYLVFLRGIDVPYFYAGRLSLLNRLLAPLIKSVCSNSEMVIANSYSLQKLAYKSITGKTIRVIPNVVDTDFFAPSARRGNADTVKALFIGRLNEQKGLFYLLEAASKILNAGLAGFTLEIAGDGPEKTRLERRIGELNISKNVLLTGWSGKDGLLEKYREADFFVTSSLDEGMPNVILEAMACGLPVIASDIPAHRELIADGINGLLVSPKDPAGLADAINKMAKDRGLRERISASNLEKIKEYSLKRLSTYLGEFRC